MGAPTGNQFWKIRSKHGRNKLFETPEMLMEAAEEYFDWCDRNPWEQSETTTSETTGITSKEKKNARPYTLKGLCIYLGCSSSYIRGFKKDIKDKAEKTPQDNDFITVIEQIEEIIYTQKFEGAAVGAFNANLIARDLGLADKQTLDVTKHKPPKINFIKRKRSEG